MDSINGFDPSNHPLPEPGQERIPVASNAPIFKRVLACTDFSPASRLAIAEAVRICRNSEAKLILLHIFEAASPLIEPKDRSLTTAELWAREAETLEAMRAEICTTGICAEIAMQDGITAETILKVIAERDIDLAVLGTHGFSGLERLLFGSTAETVLRKAICPVMTVGPRAATHLLPVSQQPSPSHCSYPQPVVFATDFQAPDKKALTCAAALANGNEGALHCLHVLPLAMEGNGESAAPCSIMKQALNYLVQEGGLANRQPVCSIAYDSEVSHAIVDYAKAHNAKFIVLAVRRGFRHTVHLPPHITYRTIVTAPCPVITVSYDDTWYPALTAASL